MRMKPLDPAYPIQQQLALDAEGPATLVNLFTVDVADEEAFLTAWAVDAAYGQTDLFATANPKAPDLLSAMDSLNARYGRNTVVRGAGMRFAVVRH